MFYPSESAAALHILPALVIESSFLAAEAAQLRALARRAQAVIPRSGEKHMQKLSERMIPSNIIEERREESDNRLPENLDYSSLSGAERPAGRPVLLFCAKSSSG